MNKQKKEELDFSEKSKRVLMWILGILFAALVIATILRFTVF